jgi:hypothetical protein
VIRLFIIAAAILTSLVLGGCDDDGSNDAQAKSTGVGSATQAVLELDCVVRDYPCSWSDATPEAARRSDDIMQIAAAFLSRGDSVDDVAAAIKAAPDVVDAAHDELGIMFRVDGGVPVMIDIDPTGTGELLLGGTQPPTGTQLPSLAQSAGGAFTGCPVAGAREGSDGMPGVTLTPGQGKKALILSPWQFGLPWDVDTLTDNLLLPGSKYLHAYGGSVTTIQTLAPDRSVLDADAANVVPADFCGWEQYDTIILMTHGRALCDSIEDNVARGCLTSFHVGQYSETPDELRTLVGSAEGVTIGTGQYGDVLPDLTDAQWDACHDALEELVYPAGTAEMCFERLPEPTYTVKVTTDFFRSNYPSGLPDRLIFIAACQGMKLKDIAEVLGVGDGNGQLFGFNKITALAHAQVLLEEFTRRLGNSQRIGADYKLWANNFLDRQNANPDLWDFPLSELPGGELGDLVDRGGTPAWGSDAVRILSAGTELTDRAQVVPADQPPDALDLTLVLTDVEEDETPESYGVEVRFNDEPLELKDIRWEPGDRTSYTADVTVELPRPLESGETFDLEISAQLPAADGAPTLWEYKDLTAGTGTCLLRFDYSGSVSSNSAYSGPITGSAEYSVNADDAQEGGSMLVLNIDANGQRVEAVTVLVLTDDDPQRAQAVLVTTDGPQIPLGEAGTFAVPGGMEVKPTDAVGAFEFDGQFEITITSSVIAEREGTPFVQMLGGTFRSAGALPVHSPFGDFSGSVTVTDGEFSFDANSCSGFTY